MVCCYLRSFSWLSPLIAAVVSVSASVFQTKSTNHWVFPDFDIMKGSISLPKVIKVSFWEVWNPPFTWKRHEFATLFIIGSRTSSLSKTLNLGFGLFRVSYSSLLTTYYIITWLLSIKITRILESIEDKVRNKIETIIIIWSFSKR